MALRPAAATCSSKHSSPPGLVICTRCTLGAAPFRVSGLCSISNPISRSDDDGDVSVSASPLKNTRRISASIALGVYATVTLGAGKGTSEDVASARVLIVRAAARSARRIAADMTPQRAARCVFSQIESNVYMFI